MNNDFDIIHEWIHQYSKQLLRIANVHTGNWATAEDAVQNAFIKASRSIRTLRNTDQPFNWLVRITLNECHAIWRRSRRETPRDEIESDSDGSPEAQYINKETLQVIHKSVTNLPLKYRTPIALFYFEDMSVNDIAAIMNRNPQTIKTWLKRGRERIAKELGREGQYEPGG